MKIDNNIANRISQDYQVSKEMYLIGLFDVQRRLFEELINLLKIEDRAFGVMKSYIKICMNSFPTQNGEDQEIYDRILFLLKPVFQKEFKRLTKRRLSPADAVITLLHKTLSIIRESIDEDSPLLEPLEKVKEVIDKIWDNIRNRTKKDALYYYSDLIKTLISEGLIGKYPISAISFREEKKKELLRNPGVRFKEESPDKVIEINLM